MNDSEKRCKTCKHWRNACISRTNKTTAESLELHDGKLWADCHRAIDGPSVTEEPYGEEAYKTSAMMVAWDEEHFAASLETREDFGCVQWEQL